MLYSLIHHITCRFEARQALIYQLASGLTGENGKYNYSKAVHLYPPFFDIFCSPKNYKTASALTMDTEEMLGEEFITDPDALSVEDMAVNRLLRENDMLPL